MQEAFSAAMAAMLERADKMSPAAREALISCVAVFSVKGVYGRGDRRAVIEALAAYEKDLRAALENGCAK